MATHSRIHAWKSHGQKSLVGNSPWGHKESDKTERLSTHELRTASYVLTTMPSRLRSAVLYSTLELSMVPIIRYV